MFIYVVRHRAGQVGDEHQYLVRSDHDPTAEELDALLNLGYDDITDVLQAERYDLESIPQLPSKGTQ